MLCSARLSIQCSPGETVTGNSAHQACERLSNSVTKIETIHHNPTPTCQVGCRAAVERAWPYTVHLTMSSVCQVFMIWVKASLMLWAVAWLQQLKQHRPYECEIHSCHKIEQLRTIAKHTAGATLMQRCCAADHCASDSYSKGQSVAAPQVQLDHLLPALGLKGAVNHAWHDSHKAA